MKSRYINIDIMLEAYENAIDIIEDQGIHSFRRVLLRRKHLSIWIWIPVETMKGVFSNKRSSCKQRLMLGTINL